MQLETELVTEYLRRVTEIVVTEWVTMLPNGTLFNGTFYNGTFFNGTYFNGTFFNGTFGHHNGSTNGTNGTAFGPLRNITMQNGLRVPGV